MPSRKGTAGVAYFYSRPCGRGDHRRAGLRSAGRRISTHAPAGGATDTSSGTFAAVSDKQALIGGLLDADGAVTMDIPVAGGEAQIGIDLTGCKRFVKITGTVSFTGGTTPAATATYALALGDPAQEPVE